MRCATVVERHDQRWPIAQVSGDVGVDDAARHAGLDAVADFHHHAVVGGQYLCGFAAVDAGGGVGADDADGFADVFFQQFLRGQQVEIEILLDDGQLAGIAQAAKQGGFRPYLAADIAKRQRALAAGYADFALVFYQGQVFVVDGDCDVLLVLQVAGHFGGGYGGRGGHRAGNGNQA